MRNCAFFGILLGAASCASEPPITPGKGTPQSPPEIAGNVDYASAVVLHPDLEFSLRMDGRVVAESSVMPERGSDRHAFKLTASAGAVFDFEITELGTSAGLDMTLWLFGPESPSGAFEAELGSDDDSGFELLPRMPGWATHADGTYLLVAQTYDGSLPADARFRLEAVCVAGPCPNSMPVCEAGTCEPAPDWTRDVASTDLALDLTTRTGTATLVIAPSSTAGLSLEIGDLEIARVHTAGTDLLSRQTGGEIDVGLPPSSAPIEVTLEYRFSEHRDFDGWMGQLSFLWPTYCGNLFPCRSNPADGSRFSMSVTGAPADQMLVYPEAIPSEAPAYMPAIAVGDYQFLDLGTTTAGTAVGVWYLPATEAAARSGTAGLRGYVDYFERLLGPYSFGARVGSVEAPWSGGGYGGMEHHPYWHVGTGSMGDANTHAHEAAHGWFGNGVRIACWEDFVLSEGLATYLAARAMESVGGATVGARVWEDYDRQLRDAVAGGDTLALPDTSCNEIEIISDPLWSSIPYMKGAHFLRAVETRIGRDALDRALSSFYQEHVGRAVRMADLIAALELEAGMSLSDLADGWLRSLGTPTG